MIRQSFRPEEIRILFVEESPPVGGTFFYCGNSQMFNNMNRVIGGHLFESTNNFLINFMENGCYLDDLVLSPVNKKVGQEKVREEYTNSPFELRNIKQITLLHY